MTNTPTIRWTQLSAMYAATIRVERQDTRPRLARGLKVMLTDHQAELGARAIAHRNWSAAARRRKDCLFHYSAQRTLRRLRNTIPCPVCGEPWDMSRCNACQCGACLATKPQAPQTLREGEG